MRFKIKYGLLSFLLLLAVIHTAVGGSVVSPSVYSQEQGRQGTGLSEPTGESDVNLTDQLSDISLCHIQPVQTGSSLASKRTQGFKDLLLMHACKLSKDVKASPADHIRFTDELTHIYLFLFPHHFFW